MIGLFMLAFAAGASLLAYASIGLWMLDTRHGLIVSKLLIHGMFWAPAITLILAGLAQLRGHRPTWALWGHASLWLLLGVLRLILGDEVSLEHDWNVLVVGALSSVSAVCVVYLVLQNRHVGRKASK
jgi:hypothetical protein